ncbi:helix-turn-helix transcriptional regulator [Leifsonia sp. NPDC058230]|uniref:helix-turn-helix transcriptional regulator n=1 Tax=Leifsonia sp. NPDC058230 TaxID=3346391 RepID=UPI0036DCD937
MIAAYSTPGGRARVCPEFVGREDLLALAERRWAESAEGSGQLLVLAGEAGIGKSRLLDEMVARIAAPRTIEVGAFPSDRETPGVLLLGLSAELRRAGESELADRIRSLVIEDGMAGDPLRRRRLMVAELTGAVEDALATPTLLRLEDIHWADELSLEVLERVAGALRSSPSMALVTYRTEELFPQTEFQLWRTRLLAQRRAEEVRLSRLDADGTARMFASILGREAAEDERDRLLAASDGIPLHIEELVAGGFEHVPDTIAEAVIDRTRRLRPRTREALSAAAVIGRSFDAALLARITGDSAIEVEIMLDELMVEHFVVRRSDDRFDFRHALIRDAVYEDTGAAHRRSLHAAVAWATDAARFPAAWVSDHFERAGLADEAYGRALAAADRASHVSAHREAAELFERAERTMPADASMAEQANLHRLLAAEQVAVDDNEAAETEYLQAIDLLRAEGDEVAAAELVPSLVAVRHLLGADLESRMRDLDDALARLDGLPENETRHARAQLLASLAAANMLDRRLEDAEGYGQRAAALIAADDLESRSGVDATIGSVFVFAGRLDEGWALLESTIERSVEAGLEASAARAYRMLGTSASVLVAYARAERWLTDGIRYTRSVERWNDAHYLTAHLAHVRWATGDWVDATELASRALADGRCAITTRVTALHVLGYLALGRADFEGARTILNEARAIGEGMRELQRLSPALWGLAELALREERFGDAVELCEAGFEASARVTDAAYLFPFVVTGTRAILAGGAPGAAPTDTARAWIDKCAVLLRRRGIPGTLSAISHAEGLLELASGRPGQARILLETASAGWDANSRWWEGTEALIDRAVCATRSRSPAAASELIAEAMDRATSTGAAALVAQAERAGRGVPRDDGTFPLTAREVEVARLVATGSTNRQIAASLSIAPKTVGSHVEHILAKLGAARRAEIAAWAAEHPRARAN